MSVAPADPVLVLLPAGGEAALFHGEVSLVLPKRPDAAAEQRLVTAIAGAGSVCLRLSAGWWGELARGVALAYRVPFLGLTSTPREEVTRQVSGSMLWGGGPPGEAVRTVLDRYDLAGLVGEGGFGRVFRARDRLTDELVAVKILHAGVQLDRSEVRREWLLLGTLRVPGVVRLLDEGVHVESADAPHLHFLVMDWVEGAPFPALDRPFQWSHLRPRLVSLLAALVEVHAAGVVHRDLKPQNALVDGEGNVHLVDFDLALGPGQLPLKGVGTVRYIAPEVMHRKAATAAADLYAVGVMVLEALTGQAMVPGGSTPALHQVAPPEVAALVQAMLSNRPEDRPTAEGALTRIGEDRSERVAALAAHLPEVATVEDLRGLFQGPQRVFHIPADSGAALFRATGGGRREVVTELARWLRLGIGRVMARPGGARERVWMSRNHVVAAEHLVGGAPRSEDPVSAVQHLLDGGRVRDAAFRAEQALLGLRIEGGDPAVEGALCRVFALGALAELEDQGVIDRAAYALARCRAPFADAPALGALLSAARMVARQQPAVALERLDVLGPLEDLALERARRVLMVQALLNWGHPDTERRIVACIDWAEAQGDVGLVARAHNWAGVLARRRGDFRDAHRLGQLGAAAGPLTARVRSATNALASLREVDVAAAEEAVEGLLRLVNDLRHPSLALRAEVLMRSVVYRRRRFEGGPDEALIEAFESLEGHDPLAGIGYLTEAAFAWRVGDRPRAAALASQAAQRFRVAQAPMEAVARALLLACAGPNPGLPAALQLVTQSQGGAPYVLVQVLGLLGGAGLLPDWCEVIRAGLDQLGPRDPDLPLDVLSPSECFPSSNPTARSPE